MKSSRLISLFINASDIYSSVLFNFLLANITISLCFFFLFLVVFNSFFTVSEGIENARVKLALAICTGAQQLTVANDAIKMLLDVTYKAINDLSK